MGSCKMEKKKPLRKFKIVHDQLDNDLNYIVNHKKTLWTFQNDIECSWLLRRLQHLSHNKSLVATDADLSPVIYS
jgi:hypothetical protein